METAVVGEWLTVEEAAAILRVHPHSVYRWCRAGQLQHTRVGRGYRVSRAAVTLLAEAGPTSPVAAGEARLAAPTITARSIALVGQKGGIGKSTSAVNLSAAIAERGYQVVVIDLDIQANATSTLTGQDDVSPHVGDVLVQNRSLADCVRPSTVPGVSILPSNITLANIEPLLGNKPAREFLLRPIVTALQEQFDVVILDTAPSLGVLTVAALMAADEFIVPVRPHVYSANALRSLFAVIAELQAAFGHGRPRLGGLLINQGLIRRDGTPRGGAYQDIVEALRSQYGDAILTVAIPDAIAIEEAHQRNTSVLQWQPTSPAAQAYRRLAEEVLVDGR